MPPAERAAKLGPEVKDAFKIVDTPNSPAREGVQVFNCLISIV